MKLDERDQLLFQENYNPEKYERGGLRYFKKLKLRQFRRLLERNLLSLYPWRRYAEYYWYLERFGQDDTFFLHGFACSKERGGSIVLEGIGRERNFSEDEKEAKKIFRFLFMGANQFSLSPPWAWYD